MIDKDGNLVYDTYDHTIHTWMGDAEEPILEQRTKRVMEDADWAILLSNQIRDLPETTERS
jgi:hypothetical protein